ncbi:hypothetical protein [Campylobacter devanensis]|uniref:hypothetical protein n=1 Tax=Campylobacter devanensis TaxID=3161138 RepID=UPI001EEFF949|nr:MULTISPECIES: hypothetical protein [unclassified Campylobacter]
MNTKSRIAIYLYGHMRTYKQTYKSFLENIVYPNVKDGYIVDVFIHTWSIFNITDPNLRHKQHFFPTLSHKELTQEDMEDIINVYNPKKIVFEKDNGKPAQRYYKIKAVNQLRLDYEKEHNIKYDFFITTRPDIYFLKPFRLNEYLDFYATHSSFKDKQLPDKFNFAGCHHFRHPVLSQNLVSHNPADLIVMDPRFPNESDTFWASNYHDGTMCALEAYRHPDNPLNIFIQYRLNMEYILFRELSKTDNYNIIVANSKINELKKSQDKLSELQLQLDAKTKENIEISSKFKSLEDSINSSSTKMQILEIKNLEQDLINKKLRAKVLEKELQNNNDMIQENKRLKENITQLKLELDKVICIKESKSTAQSRIQNQLSYKLGRAMIENSKSIWGYIRMPYVLSYIKDQHQKEQKAYNEKIKANPNLKLPPIESYPDYKEALKEKECLTYKLGAAMIEASKNWYKGGYIKLLLDIKKLKNA